MSKCPRVAVSIFMISIMILPGIFILTFYLPQFIYDTMNTLYGDPTILFTVSAIIILAIIFTPPLRKHHRVVFSKVLNVIFKKFFRSKSKEDVVFKDNIINFATADESTDDFILTNELVEDVIETYKISNIKHPIPRKQSKNTQPDLQFFTYLPTSRKQYKEWISYPTFFIKNINTTSNFDPISKIFWWPFCNKTACTDIILGGRGHGGFLDNSKTPHNFDQGGN